MISIISSHVRAADWLSLRKLIIIVFVSALAAFAAYQSRVHYEQQARTSADNLSQVLGNHISSAIEKIDLVLKTVVRDVLQHQLRGSIDRHDLELLLAQEQMLLPDATDLLIADPEGVLRYGADVPPGFRIDISDLDYFKRLRDDPMAGLVISGPYQSRVDKQWVMVFARRMTRPDGSFAGIVSSAISADHFQEMLMPLKLGARGMAALWTTDMVSVAQFPATAAAEAAGSKVVSPGFAEALKNSPDFSTFVGPGPFDTVKRTTAYRKLNGLPLYTIVGLATADYLAAWWEEVLELAGMIAVFILATLRLSHLARRAASRQRNISRLLREAVENAAVGFAIFDPLDRLTFCNEDSRDFFPEYRGIPARGGRFEDLLRSGMTRAGFPFVVENPEQWIQERLRLHLAADGTPVEMRLKDGRQLLSIEHRTPCGHTIANRIDITELAQYRRHLEDLVDTRTAELQADITQRKLAEQRLQEERKARQAILEQQVTERTAELQEANRQLEGFLYAASHDLKGPLGRISNFSSLLERDYRDRLEGDGLLFLGFIRENALRLMNLIDDLLCHARVDQMETELQPIDLPAAVQAAVNAKADDIRDTGTTVKGKLPPVRVLADSYALDQVLHNLLDNALKYSAEGDRPTIEIGGEALEGCFRFWMRDNGIGFDMEYHDKIFEIFRRLHTHAQYAGSGVGLALVKRAMERMGGTVWAESEPGRGATFYLQFRLCSDAIGKSPN